MQQIAKFSGRKEQSRIPVSGDMVKARSLLPAELARNTAVVFVRYQDKVYGVTTSSLVPKEAVLERDEQGQICGIAAVVGGSGNDCVIAETYELIESLSWMAEGSGEDDSEYGN